MLQSPCRSEVETPPALKDARLVQRAAICGAAVEKPSPSHWEYLAQVWMNTSRSSVSGTAAR